MRPKLTAKQVAEIRHAYAGGEWPLAVLARRFGVSGSTVADVVHGKPWPTGQAPDGAEAEGEGPER